MPRKLQLPAVDGLVAHISKRCACVLPKELEQLEVEEYEGYVCVQESWLHSNQRLLLTMANIHSELCAPLGFDDCTDATRALNPANCPKVPSSKGTRVSKLAKLVAGGSGPLKFWISSHSV